MARKLRVQYPGAMDWIAQQLYMGSAGHVSHLFYQKASNPPDANEDQNQDKLF
jgi:hypothetical protein